MRQTSPACSWTVLSSSDKQRLFILEEIFFQLWLVLHVFCLSHQSLSQGLYFLLKVLKFSLLYLSIFIHLKYIFLCKWCEDPISGFPDIDHHYTHINCWTVSPLSNTVIYQVFIHQVILILDFWFCPLAYLLSPRQHRILNVASQVVFSSAELYPSPTARQHLLRLTYLEYLGAFALSDEF